MSSVESATNCNVSSIPMNSPLLSNALIPNSSSASFARPVGAVKFVRIALSPRPASLPLIPFSAIVTGKPKLYYGII